MGKMKAALFEVTELYQEGWTIQKISDYTGFPFSQVEYILETYYGGSIDDDVVIAKNLH